MTELTRLLRMISGYHVNISLTVIPGVKWETRLEILAVPESLVFQGSAATVEGAVAELAAKLGQYKSENAWMG